MVNSDEIYRLMVQHEREMREQSAAALAQALDLHSREIARRLDDLDHAHARALEDKAEFLQKSLYEQAQREFIAWKLEVTKQLAEDRQDHSSTQRNFAVGLLIAMPIISVVVDLLLRKL